MFDSKDMKLLNGKITLVDLIIKENKSTTDNRLETITKSKERPKPMIWNEFLSGAGGSYETWVFSEIPQNLQFFEKIRVVVINYNILPMPYMITIEGVLSESILKKLEASDNETCRKQIEKFKNDFWIYWKDNISGIVSESKSIYAFNGTGITDFYFKITNTDELLKKDEQFSKKFREQPFLSKYGANIGGLISITEAFQNKISVVSQGNAVLYGSDFDFSWISKFEFFTDENQILKFNNNSLSPFTRYDNLLQLLLTILWQDYRINDIDKWKNKILKFSKELEKFQIRGGKLKSKEMEVSPLSEKKDFLIDFTSILDENRFIARFIQVQRSRYNDKIGGELPLTGTTLVGIENEGFLYNFYNSISSRNNIIKEEYDILDNQYEILSAHLNQILRLVNAKSSVQLSESNKWTQIVIIGLAAVTLIVTFAIYEYNATLVSLTQQLVTDSGYTKKLLSTIDKSNSLTLASLYSNYQLKLQYEIDPFDQHGSPIGRFYNLWVTNYGDYDAQVNSTYYFNTGLCNQNGSLTIDRTLTTSNSITESNIILKKGTMEYQLEIPKIYPNFTNLRSFTLEMVAKGTPVTPDNTPVHYFTKWKTTRILFIHDNTTNNWIPQLSWEEPNCNAKLHGPINLLLHTTNMTEFRDIG